MSRRNNRHQRKPRRCTPPWRAAGVSPLIEVANLTRYIAHNSLAVEPQTREVIGLCNQVLHRRPKVSKSETNAQKRKRETRESLLWPKGPEPLPTSWQFVDVCDRGADSLDFLEHEVNSGRRFVIRSCYHRRTFVGHDEPATSDINKLHEYARTLPQASAIPLTNPNFCL